MEVKVEEDYPWKSQRDLLLTMVPTWDQRDLSIPETAEQREARQMLHDFLTDDERAARWCPDDVRFEHEDWEDPHHDGFWMNKFHCRLPEPDRALLRALRCADKDGTRAALESGADPNCVPTRVFPHRPGENINGPSQMSRIPMRDWGGTGEPLYEPPLCMAIAMCDWKDPRDGDWMLQGLLFDRCGFPGEDEADSRPDRVSAFRALPRNKRCTQVEGVLTVLLTFEGGSAVDVNGRYGRMAHPALGRAVRMNNLPAVRVLLSHGALLELSPGPKRPIPLHGAPIDDWVVREAQPSFSALCHARTTTIVQLLIQHGADIGWSPVVATTSTEGGEKQHEPQSDKTGTTPLLSALDKCGWYMHPDPVSGMEVIQALLLAGADIAQGGWRSRGNQGEGVYLTWQTPHSWFTLLDSEEQYGFGPGTKQMIRSMFQEHGKHRTAVRALRGMRLPPKVIALIVDGHAGLALPRRKRKVFAQAEGVGW